MTGVGLAALLVFAGLAAAIVARPFLTSRAPGRIHWPSFVWGVTASLIAVAVAGGVVLATRDAPGRPAQNGGAPSDGMVAALARTASQHPRDAQSWLLLARARFMRGEVADAIAAYTQILQIDPTHAQALAELSLVFYDRGLAEVAYKTAQRALELDADNLSALWVAGQVLMARGDDTKAIQVWERFLRVSPPGPEAALARRYIAQARARRSAP